MVGGEGTRPSSQSPRGEVLASHQVVHLARRIEGLHFESRGRIALKGLAEPVEVVRVVAGDAPGWPAAAFRRARPRRWQRRALAAALAGFGVLAAVIALVATRPTGATASASRCELAVGSLSDPFNKAIFDGLTRAAADYGTTIGGARQGHRGRLDPDRPRAGLSPGP